MNEASILVVDNEPQIRRVMRTTLVSEGFEVDDAKCGDEALERIHLAKYDLILLDINMPGANGLETCRAIRAVSGVPIIMLTVRTAERDKVQALDAGADDYITKPFSMPELLARARAALRRMPLADGTPHVLHLGDVEVNFVTRRLTAGGREIRLTRKEFDLLQYLASHPDTCLSHSGLLQAIWGPEYSGAVIYLRVLVRQLRKKIEPDPHH